MDTTSPVKESLDALNALDELMTFIDDPQGAGLSVSDIDNLVERFAWMDDEADVHLDLQDQTVIRLSLTFAAAKVKGMQHHAEKIGESMT